MELRQLASFVAVAEELSFTKAARRLRVVQSGVSTAIRALEREVGTPLFERDSRHVTLTEAGAAMLPSARAALAAARAAHDAVQARHGELHGAVVLASMLSTPGVDVAGVLGRFHRAHPAVRVRVQYSQSGSRGHVHALLDGTVDVALVSFPRRPPPGLTAELLTTEMLRLVCGPGHPLAGAAEVRLEDLAGETFAEFPEGWGTRDLVDLAFDRHGLSRSVPLEVPDYATAAALIRQGHVLGFLPESVALAHEELSVVPVAERLAWNVTLATSASRPLSRPALALMAELRRCVTR
ncbi:DNA-binding transcriptional LysR family regulator [Amycolatopsis bartoniae]|uniref:LysR family transcriptional regulator n=1 Tax=Amycolatopsis bartoniae TaxID=941986 RepID=A0A8H9IVR4_9PSEU|nr:LysR substrate-binding domain-containing protein [Amycolatopsis bartoniae]MBB2936685.1 DNA-binding transcriptional LysR family regulator [Amycolatopsis bartoniae]GHF67112.1 LysR family transcriptional regulator [Amycolatopsis bartoniae]